MPRRPSELRAQLEAGFVVPALGRDVGEGTRLWPWGTVPDAIAGLIQPGGAADRGCELPGMHWCGLDLSAVQLRFVGARGPIESVDYLLGAQLGAHLAAGFDPLRERFVEALALAGTYREYPDYGGHPASRVRASHEFVLDGVTLGLSSYGAPRDTAAGPCGGSIWIRASSQRLAVPFLPRFDAADEPWSQRPGRVVQSLPVPGLRRVDSLEREPNDVRAFQALRYPQRRAPPPWLRAELAPERVLHWTSEGYWGLACLDYTLVFERDVRPGFRHTRMLPARGGGAAYLTREGLEGSNWSTQPGPAGLDALVAHLEAMGCPIAVETLDDV